MLSYSELHWEMKPGIARLPVIWRDGGTRRSNSSHLAPGPWCGGAPLRHHRFQSLPPFGRELLAPEGAGAAG
ncbi:hypothetical protein [Rhodoferax sp.]|uniref:hypothetical protein n=1 Tax=Rhodoferax sp. TaxID=50421 RepID=UPI00285271E4|nr:hypothetical protein [Rhodoferax sp.]